MALSSFIQVAKLANRAPGYNRHVPQTAPKITKNGPATLAMVMGMMAGIGKSREGEGAYNNFPEICKENGKNLGGIGQFLTNVKTPKFSSLRAKIFSKILAGIKIKH